VLFQGLRTGTMVYGGTELLCEVISQQRYQYQADFSVYREPRVLSHQQRVHTDKYEIPICCSIDGARDIRFYPSRPHSCQRDQVNEDEFRFSDRMSEVSVESHMEN